MTEQLRDEVARNKALEKAAKVAEKVGKRKFGCTTRSAICAEVASEIRALQEQNKESR